MFSLQKLKESNQGIWLAIDFAMMFLLIINLLLIIFDSLYAVEAIRSGLGSAAPWFNEAYDPVHNNFLLVDLAFISVFLSEFVLRWIVAVRNKEYLRWYFFPFIHWYDLVGCIPVDAARIFRLLRIVSILHRLHKYRIIDLKDTAVFRFMRFYYNVFIEELSDRIVVKVLTDAQEDIAAGSKLLDAVNQQVLKPRTEVLTQWLAANAQHLGNSFADPNKGQFLRQHVARSVSKSVRSDPQVKNLNLIPVLGNNLEKRLETAVANIVVNSIVNLLQDLDDKKVQEIVRSGLITPSIAENELNEEVLAIINEVLELVKEHVSDKRWQEKLN